MTLYGTLGRASLFVYLRESLIAVDLKYPPIPYIYDCHMCKLYQFHRIFCSTAIHELVRHGLLSGGGGVGSVIAC